MAGLEGMALVTGAGSGIGLAIATRLAREGAAVAVVDIDAQAAERGAATINEQAGAGGEADQPPEGGPGQQDDGDAGGVVEQVRAELVGQHRHDQPVALPPEGAQEIANAGAGGAPRAGPAVALPATGSPAAREH